MTILSLVFSIIFIGIGGYLAYNHINRFKQKDKLRAQVIELNNEYVKEDIPSIIDNSINLEHNGNTICG